MGGNAVSCFDPTSDCHASLSLVKWFITVPLHESHHNEKVDEDRRHRATLSEAADAVSGRKSKTIDYGVVIGGGGGGDKGSELRE